jgi:tRNA(fMet)-specific endonuclease VapC
VSRLTIDTNIYSELKRGNPAVVALLEHAEEIHVPSVVLGELHAGFNGGNAPERNRAELAAFLAQPGVEVTDITRDVALRYGNVVGQLRKAGTPLPVNDIWIAACSLETGTRLTTLDAHFTKVPGLFLQDI